MINEFNLNKKDYYILTAITVLSLALTCNYIIFNSALGIYCSDVYVYLLNSLYYAGTNLHSTITIYLSPLICFLTSILFRLGFVDKTSIYIVTGAFAIFGNIGFYILLRRYFNETLSLTGTVIYSSSTLYLTWLANGTLDIPAVSMIIWTALFCIIAVDENPRYYRYAVIFIILGIFTRYTVLLTVPAFLLYYIYKKGFEVESEDRKEIRKAIKIGLIIIIVTMAIILILGNGNFGAKSQISDGISGAQGAEIDPAYNTDVSYYLTNFPNFISNSHTPINGNPVLENPTPLSWAVIGIIIIGMCLWLFEHERKFEKNDLLPLTLFLIAVVSFTRISSMVTTFFVLCGLYFMGKDSDNKTEYFMLAWIFSNIIFFSYYNIKVNRYCLPIFPALIYFILLSTDTMSNKIRINENIIPAILIVAFIVQAFTFTFTFDVTDEYKVAEDVSDYIIENNPDYQNMSIGAYNIRAYDWWLGKDLIPIKSSDEKRLEQSNATYYISNKVLSNVENYTIKKNISDIFIYEKSV